MQPLKTLKNIIVAMVVITIFTICSGTAFAGNADTTEHMQYFLQALIQVESVGNDRAIGDHNKREMAYGPLQVRQPCVDDVNRRYGTHIKAKDLMGDRATSMWVCQKYLGLYATQRRLGKEPAYEDMARIWNGGPNGWKSKGTIAYWSKVNRQLQKIEIAKAKSPATPTAVAKVKPPNLSGITLAVVVKR
jgi:hypothetical protein